MDGDRISDLPDEIIHHIMSFNDTKYAVQTSVLSSRWKLVWTTLPYLKFSTDKFLFRVTKFSMFVNRVLSLRDNQIEVSSLDLHFRGPAYQELVQEIANYAVSHNVQKVNIFACRRRSKEEHQLPLCFFSSQSLKHLSVKKTYPLHSLALPQSPWDSPALTTIELDNVRLCDKNTTCLDLFSKCASLRKLTLSNCCTNVFKVMKIMCPRLVHLTISNCWPSLYEILAPNLSSVYYKGGIPLFLSTGGLNSLEKVNLHMYTTSSTLNKDEMQRQAHAFMNMLHELRNARFVTLNGPAVEFLSEALDLVEHQPSPFCNLKCLTIVEMQQKRAKSELTSVVINYLLNGVNYLLNSSPAATVSMELPKSCRVPDIQEQQEIQKKRQLVQKDIQVRQHVIANLEQIITRHKQLNGAWPSNQQLMQLCYDVRILRVLFFGHEE